MMEEVRRIDIASDFSKYPAGRYRSDGKHSGEVFREDFLYPALVDSRMVELCLDGAMGYGSSFLEEAFGGLVRVHHLDPSDLRKKLVIVTERMSVEKEIWSYIDRPNS